MSMFRTRTGKVDLLGLLLAIAPPAIIALVLLSSANTPKWLRDRLPSAHAIVPQSPKEKRQQTMR